MVRCDGYAVRHAGKVRATVGVSDAGQAGLSVYATDGRLVLYVQEPDEAPDKPIDMLAELVALRERVAALEAQLKLRGFTP